MNIKFTPVDLSEIKPELLKNIESYHHPIDSYYEDHVIESRHYRIVIETTTSGYISIFDNKMLTQFHLDKFNCLAGEVFMELLSNKRIAEMYVSTSDSQLLVLALDNQKGIDVQDYVFQVDVPNVCIPEFTIKTAESIDKELILMNHDGFFQNIEDNLARKELYICRNEDIPVSFGIIEKSKLNENYASIGMFVVKSERGRGYGSMTIIRLIEMCQKNRVIPVAGCFSKNEYSKKALLKAGMYSNMRLLKIKV